MMITTKPSGNALMKLHENVIMPDRQFLLNFFHYQQVNPGAVFPRHWHEQLELIYITQGVMQTTANNRLLETRAGDLLVINTNELHEGVLVEGPLSLYCIIIDLSLLQSRYIDSCEAKYIYPISQNFILFHNLISSDATLKDNITQIAHEYDEKETGYELAVKAAIYNLIVHLIRRYTVKILTSREYEARNYKLQVINTALKYIDDNYTENLETEALAKLLGVSKSHFCRLFKESTGKTLVEYLHSYRIREAVKLLNQTELTITEIALQVGFNDINYFSRLFKRYIGASPTEARTQAIW